MIWQPMFISSHTGEAWTRDQKLSENFADVLSGTRLRTADNYCRHSCAITMLISLIEQPAVAYQMSDDRQICKIIYAKWISTELLHQ